MSNQKPSKHGHPIDIEMEEALRAVGFTPSEIDEGTPQGVVIFKYTRKQAIEDGVLVDVTPIAQKAGFRIHTAMTSGVVGEITAMIRKRRPEDFEKYPLYRIQAAGFRAVLETLRDKIAHQKNASDRLDFQCDEVSLWAHIGPGDEGEPVLTVMLIGVRPVRSKSAE